MNCLSWLLRAVKEWFCFQFQTEIRHFELKLAGTDLIKHFTFTGSRSLGVHLVLSISLSDFSLFASLKQHNKTKLDTKKYFQFSILVHKTKVLVWNCTLYMKFLCLWLKSMFEILAGSCTRTKERGDDAEAGFIVNCCSMKQIKFLYRVLD